MLWVRSRYVSMATREMTPAPPPSHRLSLFWWLHISLWIILQSQCCESHKGTTAQVLEPSSLFNNLLGWMIRVFCAPLQNWPSDKNSKQCWCIKIIQFSTVWMLIHTLDKMLSGSQKWRFVSSLFHSFICVILTPCGWFNQLQSCKNTTRKYSWITWGPQRPSHRWKAQITLKKI